MSLISIIIWLIIGAFVGWLAGLIMKSEGGLLYNIILGIVGSAVGGFI
ncbi:MAG: GlsB/YeaQ/YmgE family stress response membrane protein, partial [Spirochaetia bacterium]|nr:GlsB/YeaQ/YmgE family stress response membrane protein [Spirochaetia bacterium]